MPKGLTAVLVQPGKPLELETLPTPEIEPGGILRAYAADRFDRARHVAPELQPTAGGQRYRDPGVRPVQHEPFQPQRAQAVPYPAQSRPAARRPGELSPAAHLRAASGLSAEPEPVRAGASSRPSRS